MSPIHCASTYGEKLIALAQYLSIASRPLPLNYALLRLQIVV